MKHFVILSTQRSGSTFLRIWLNSHSEINSHGEVFLKHYQSPDGFRRYCFNKSFFCKTSFQLHHTRISRALGLQFISRTLIDGYLDDLLENPSHPGPWSDIDNRNQLIAKAPASFSGFKLMYNTFDAYRGLQEWARENPSLMVLHMTRRNLLKSFISRRRMAENKIAHTKSGTLNHKPVYIKLKNLQRYIETTHATRRQFRSLLEKRHPFLELSYEDMFADRHEFVAKILTFFSLPYEEMEPPTMRKISSSRLENEVKNCDEVIRFLSGTPNEQFLSDFEIQ